MEAEKYSVPLSDFVISDHTNASEFEVLISAISKILRAWETPKDDATFLKNFVEYKECLFQISYFTENNAQSNIHKNVLKRFQVNRCLSIVSEDTEISVYSCRLILSSLVLACQSLTDWQDVPMFVQVGTFSQQLYNGHIIQDKKRFRCSSTVKSHTPSMYGHLSGILDLFKSQSASLPIFVEVNLTYVTRCRGNKGPVQHPLSSFPPRFLSEIPGGSLVLVLTVGFDRFPEDSYIDNAVYSDLKPSSPDAVWSLRALPDPKPNCLLTGILKKFIIWGTTCSEPLKSFLTTSSQEEKGSGAFARLAGAQAAPPMFAAVSSTTNNYISQISETAMSFVGGQALEPKDVAIILSRIFENDENNLMCLLANYIVIVLVNYRGMKDVATLWAGFVKSIRCYWESCSVIHGIGDPVTNPDLKQNIIIQKIQMINCCIQNKLHRQEMLKLYKKAKSDETTPSIEAVDDSDDSDEFYDSMEVPEEEEENLMEPNDVFSLVPQGVEKTSETLFLLYHPSIPLRIPYTQNIAPVTSDIIEEKMEALAKMGQSQEASKVRAIYQSDSLFSDMKAFKAANPKGELEDFVRWHSPRDWQNDGNNGGKLSARFSEEGNLWKEAWETASSVPAAVQKSLFDHTYEAERAIRYLENVSPSLIFDCLSHFVLKSGLDLLKSSNENLQHIPPVVKLFSDMENFIESNFLSNNYNHNNNYNNSNNNIHKAFLDLCLKTERHCLDAITLLTKLNNDHKLVCELFKGRVEINSKEQKVYVGNLYKNYQNHHYHHQNNNNNNSSNSNSNSNSSSNSMNNSNNYSSDNSNNNSNSNSDAEEKFSRNDNKRIMEGFQSRPDFYEAEAKEFLIENTAGDHLCAISNRSEFRVCGKFFEKIGIRTNN